MARLANLGMPFGSPGGIINIPVAAGSGLAGQQQMNAWAGLGQALGIYLSQRRAGQDRQENIRRLQAMGPQQDIFNTMYGARGMEAPQAQMPMMVGRQAQEAQLEGMMGSIFGDPYGKPPWWVQGATPQQIQDYRGRVGGPLVQIGERLLTPEKRQEVAEAEYREKLTTKPLTPTEKKGVQSTIQEILPSKEPSSFRFMAPRGIRPGPILKQTDMDKLWESVMEATGYDGRNKTQQKQIENEFDRYVAILNKGKGIGALKGQYQWNRRKYKFQEKTQQTPTEPTMDNVEKGIRKVLASVTDANVMNRIYKEAPKLRVIWNRMSDEEKITAYEKFAEGFTAQEIIRHFTGKR